MCELIKTRALRLLHALWSCYEEAGEGGPQGVTSGEKGKRKKKKGGTHGGLKCDISTIEALIETIQADDDMGAGGGIERNGKREEENVEEESGIAGMKGVEGGGNGERDGVRIGEKGVEGRRERRGRVGLAGGKEDGRGKGNNVEREEGGEERVNPSVSSAIHKRRAANGDERGAGGADERGETVELEQKKDGKVGGFNGGKQNGSDHYRDLSNPKSGRGRKEKEGKKVNEEARKNFLYTLLTKKEREREIGWKDLEVFERVLGKDVFGSSQSPHFSSSITKGPPLSLSPTLSSAWPELATAVAASFIEKAISLKQTTQPSLSLPFSFDRFTLYPSSSRRPFLGSSTSLSSSLSSLYSVSAGSPWSLLSDVSLKIPLVSAEKRLEGQLKEAQAERGRLLSTLKEAGEKSVPLSIYLRPPFLCSSFLSFPPLVVFQLSLTPLHSLSHLLMSSFPPSTHSHTFLCSLHPLFIGFWYFQTFCPPPKKIYISLSISISENNWKSHVEGLNADSIAINPHTIFPCPVCRSEVTGEAVVSSGGDVGGMMKKMIEEREREKTRERGEPKEDIEREEGREGKEKGERGKQRRKEGREGKDSTLGFDSSSSKQRQGLAFEEEMSVELSEEARRYCQRVREERAR